MRSPMLLLLMAFPAMAQVPPQQANPASAPVQPVSRAGATERGLPASGAAAPSAGSVPSAGAVPPAAGTPPATGAAPVQPPPPGQPAGATQPPGVTQRVEDASRHGTDASGHVVDPHGKPVGQAPAVPSSRP